MSDRKICFCLAGWHFGGTVLEQLATVAGADTYVVSHRTPDQVPGRAVTTVGTDRLLFMPNLGYDWGCYQQFLATDRWRAYDLLFFMHDDLLIKDLGFIEPTVALLQAGHSVIGNGRNATIYDLPRRQPYSYAHSRWIPPSLDFRHDTVRGSFFALTAAALARLGDLEVFWDPYHISVGWGNRSLVATSGKMQHTFGEQTFAFLSDEYLVSPYLEELERGGSGVAPVPLFSRYFQSKVTMPAYRWLGTRLVVRRMANANFRMKKPDPVTRLLSQCISKASGVTRLMDG